MAAGIKAGKKAQELRGDVITVDNKGNDNAIAAGRGARASISHGVLTPEMENWRSDMEKHIDAATGLLPADKADLKENISKVADEVSKGREADSGRLERLINTLAGMAPDIFEVAVASLVNPLAGIGLVAKKVGDRVRLVGA